MSNWDALSLLEYLEKKGAEEQLEIVVDTIESIHKRFVICDYHQKEFDSVFSEFQSTTTSSPSESELERRQREMFTACTSHAFSFAQSLHAIIDTTAHVIYYSYEGGQSDIFNKITTGYVGIKKIRDTIAKTGDHQRLASAISDLIDMEEFKYLEDLTNTIKHRTLVPVLGKQELMTWRIKDLTFGSFERNGTHHSEKHIPDFFSQTKPAILEKVIAVLKELNISLGLQSEV